MPDMCQGQMLADKAEIKLTPDNGAIERGFPQLESPYSSLPILI